MKLKQLKPNRLPVLKPATGQTVQANGSAWGKGRGGRPWRRLKQKIHVRDKWTCQQCGQVTQQLELDHIINVSIGGTDNEENLQSLCVPCHKVKTQAESLAGQG